LGEIKLLRKMKQGFFQIIPVRKTAFFIIFAALILFLASYSTAGVISITATVANIAPTVSDENVFPESWAGSGLVILGFQCTDPNSAADMNKAHASITGSNTVDLNDITYVVSGEVAIIAVDITSNLATRGTYYVMPFCIDDLNNVTAGSQITGNYVAPAQITVSIPVNDANFNSNPTITFDVNKNAADDVNVETITVDLNGTASSVFNAAVDCTAFSGHYYCSYTETGLGQDADHNLSFNASDEGGNAADQVEVIVHYDATAPTIVSISASSSGSDVIVIWSGTDPFTGIEDYYIRADSGSWINNGSGTAYTFSGHASANHTYDLKAKDFADNNSLISQASYTAPVTPPGDEDGDGGGGGGGGGGIGPPIEPGEERKFDIEIIRVDNPIEVGDRFDFTYKVSNTTLEGGNAYIEYWLALNGTIPISGSETVYLRSGEEREVSDSFALLEEMEGDYKFFLKLTRIGQEPVERESASKVMLGAPLTLDLNVTSFEAGEEQEPVKFTIEIGSNQDETLPVLVEEKIFKEDRVVWEKKQTVPIKAFERFLEEIYGLEPGEYRLEVSATYEEERRTVIRPFERKAKEEPLPPVVLTFLDFFFIFFPWLLLLILLIILLYIIRRHLEKKRKRRGKHRLGH